MKHVILLVVVAMQMVQLMAQDVYFITVVRGKVFRQNNAQIQPGEKINSNEKVIFTSKDDLLILLNPKGRFEVSPAAYAHAKSGELITLLINDNLHIHAKNVRLGSRSLGNVLNLSDYFKPETLDSNKVNERFLITDEIRIPLQHMGYTGIDNTKKFFFLQLIDTNRNGTSKRLLVVNDTLVIKKDDFIFNNKLYTDADGSLLLGIVNDYPNNNNINKIADIKPVFATTAQLKQFANTIRLSLPNVPHDELFKEVYTEVYFFYGKPDEQVINKILE